jgi:hypothetical protein
MGNLRPPPRGSDPLQVLILALALVAAATMGAVLGFAIDFFSGASEQSKSGLPPG